MEAFAWRLGQKNYDKQTANSRIYSKIKHETFSSILLNQWSFKVENYKGKYPHKSKTDGENHIFNLQMQIVMLKDLDVDGVSVPLLA